MFCHCVFRTKLTIETLEKVSRVYCEHVAEEEVIIRQRRSLLLAAYKMSLKPTSTHVLPFNSSNVYARIRQAIP